MDERDVTLLDGGMGQELYRRSGRPASPLWSAQVMKDQPELVVELHRDYIASGAEVIELNAYTSTPERLARDADADLFEPLQRAALDAARQAVSESGRAVRIAGCLPPLVASYHSEVVPEEDACFDSYRRIADVQRGGVDLFLCETLSTVREGRAATRAAAETGKPVWTSFTVDDGDGTRLRSGEALADAAHDAVGAGAAAVLVNCSMPEAFPAALGVLKSTGVPFGGYANGFTSIASLDPGGTVATLEKRRDLDPAAYADHAMGWIDAGATLVGGCCEVGPAHIAEIARRLGRRD